MRADPKKLQIYYRYARRKSRRARKWLALAAGVLWIITRAFSVADYWAKRMALW